MVQQIRISDSGLDLIKEFEGDREGKIDDNHWGAYLDTIAVPPLYTIYFGLTKGVHKGMVITKEQGDEMMRRELIQCETAIENLVTVPLNQNQADSVISLAYNIGTGGLAKSTLLKLLNQGKYAAAAAQFERWNKCGGKAVNGLTRRRKREAALFMEPIAEDKSAESMPQKVDVAPAMSTADAMKSSPTVGAAGIGIAAAATKIAVGSVEVVREAGQQIIASREAVGPFTALFSALHINVDTVAITIILACLAFVAIRHVMKKREGTAL